jgi:hypothetical protein
MLGNGTRLPLVGEHDWALARQFPVARRLRIPLRRC